MESTQSEDEVLSSLQEDLDDLMSSDSALISRCDRLAQICQDLSDAHRIKSASSSRSGSPVKSVSNTSTEDKSLSNSEHTSQVPVQSKAKLSLNAEKDAIEIIKDFNNPFRPIRRPSKQSLDDYGAVGVPAFAKNSGARPKFDRNDYMKTRHNMEYYKSEMSKYVDSCRGNIETSSIAESTSTTFSGTTTTDTMRSESTPLSELERRYYQNSYCTPRKSDSFLSTSSTASVEPRKTESMSSTMSSRSSFVSNSTQYVPLPHQEKNSRPDRLSRRTWKRPISANPTAETWTHISTKDVDTQNDYSATAALRSYVDSDEFSTTKSPTIVQRPKSPIHRGPRIPKSNSEWKISDSPRDKCGHHQRSEYSRSDSNICGTKKCSHQMYIKNYGKMTLKQQPTDGRLNGSQKHYKRHTHYSSYDKSKSATSPNNKSLPDTDTGLKTEASVELEIQKRENVKEETGTKEEGTQIMRSKGSQTDIQIPCNKSISSESIVSLSSSGSNCLESTSDSHLSSPRLKMDYIRGLKEVTKNASEKDPTRDINSTATQITKEESSKKLETGGTSQPLYMKSDICMLESNNISCQTDQMFGTNSAQSHSCPHLDSYQSFNVLPPAGSKEYFSNVQDHPSPLTSLGSDVSGSSSSTFLCDSLLQCEAHATQRGNKCSEPNTVFSYGPVTKHEHHGPCQNYLRMQPVQMTPSQTGLNICTKLYKADVPDYTFIRYSDRIVDTAMERGDGLQKNNNATSHSNPPSAFYSCSGVRIPKTVRFAEDLVHVQTIPSAGHTYIPLELCT